MIKTFLVVVYTYDWIPITSQIVRSTDFQDAVKVADQFSIDHRWKIFDADGLISDTLGKTKIELTMLAWS